MIRFGLQLPSFSFPGGSDGELLDRVTEIASTAEDAGFDSFFVMEDGTR
jgi:alkanesulfonate monooxygenase SsuD/methylene tetrahydromethanopterin reductase-like flavin-dependent oxidoreductase (luciferase family)